MHYWESNRQNPIELPERWLADALGCNPKTARRVIGELDDYGFIRLERKGKLKGALKGRAAIYRLTWQPDNEGTKPSQDYLQFPMLPANRDAHEKGASTRRLGFSGAPKHGARHAKFRCVGEALPDSLLALNTQQTQRVMSPNRKRGDIDAKRT